MRVRRKEMFDAFQMTHKSWSNRKEWPGWVKDVVMEGGFCRVVATTARRHEPIFGGCWIVRWADVGDSPNDRRHLVLSDGQFKKDFEVVDK